jgi:protein-S-isoprenylcysteine O-methyltransferase Ste14
MFLTWGVFLKQPGISLLIISLLSTIFLIITAKIEEKENLRFFGEKYNDYKNRTRMFVPFLF